VIGPRWSLWFQPQHPHFVPARNLSNALSRRGSTVVAEERGTSPLNLAFTTPSTPIAWPVLPDGHGTSRPVSRRGPAAHCASPRLHPSSYLLSSSTRPSLPSCGPCPAAQRLPDY
jgi:hypothetical protein